MDWVKNCCVLAALTLAACAQTPEQKQAQADEIVRKQPGNVQELIRQAEAGDTQAMVKLGDLYRYGTGVVPNMEAALGFYQLAAQKGDLTGEVDYADMLLWNFSRYSDAAAEYKLAADQGSPEAYAALSYLYARGLGVPKDPDEAARYSALSSETPTGQTRSFMLDMKLAIDKKKVYPKRAVLSGDTGLATVSFDYDGQNGAKNVKIERSSGSKDIDQAAVNAVVNADLPPLPSALKDAHHFVVAIMFSLGR
ncbi:MAG: TonB family protein [Bacillota bacterium]